jgi:hypothetical protein
MQRLHPYALVAAAFLAALSAPPVAHAQQYREPLGSRCYNFDFGSNYGWDRYTNLCNENITVALIFPHGGRFDVQLRPGQSDGTGHSRSEYANMGQPSIFVCPTDFRIVDENDRNVTINTPRYRCKQ